MKISRYILISLGLVMLIGSVLLYLYILIDPEIEYFEKDKLSLKDVTVQFNCERSAPTPLFLNFNGNKKAPWIAVLFGREKNVALVFIHPLRFSGDYNFAAFGATKDGFKEIPKFNKTEIAELRSNFKFAPDEIAFLESCITKSYSPKYQI